MSSGANHFYEFGPFRVDVAERRLLRGGRVLPLTPKVFDTLLVLVENSGRTMGKEELMRRLWPDSFVEESSLAQNIFQLRKTLGEVTSEEQSIETIPKRGYRFAAAVREVRDSSADSTASHLAGESTAVEDTETDSTVKSLAVLPFKPMGAEGCDEFLGLGMADAIIVRLNELQQLTVLPTSAIFNYAGRGCDSFTVGRELGVDAVLDGTVQCRGERVRVTVQLVGLRQNRTLWSSKFDEKFTDIFAVQDSISEQVTQALALRLAEAKAQKKLLTRDYTENTEAYQSYLMGLHFWNKSTKEGMEKAIEHFRQAIAHDPDYAPAYAGLADAYFLIVDRAYDVSPNAISYEDVRAAARKALELDDTIGEAHAALAVVKIKWDKDPAGAESSFEHAIAVSPNCAMAHLRYTWFLAAMGRLDEALLKIKRAQELDPLSPDTNTGLGLVLYFARDYGESIRYCQRALTIEPNHLAAMLCLGLNYEQKGLYEEAIATFRKAKEIYGDDIETSELLGHALAVAGRRREALRLLSEIRSPVKQKSVSPYNVALIYGALGRAGPAFEWLEKPSANRTERLRMLRFDPRFDAFRSDARFAELLRRSISAVQSCP